MFYRIRKAFTPAMTYAQRARLATLAGQLYPEDEGRAYLSGALQGRVSRSDAAGLIEILEIQVAVFRPVA